MTPGEFIDFDMENASPLWIKTSSMTETAVQTQLFFYDEEGRQAGKIYIVWNWSQVQYHLPQCHTYIKFPKDVPPEPDKVWKITYTTNPETKLIINVNGEEVLNQVLSDSYCEGDTSWKYFFGKRVVKIQFSSGDKASNFYSYQDLFFRTGNLKRVIYSPPQKERNTKISLAPPHLKPTP